MLEPEIVVGNHFNLIEKKSLDKINPPKKMEPNAERN
jgi:hypothetical protein